MKRAQFILLTFALALVNVGCVVESYEKPEITERGYETASLAASHLATNASLVDLVSAVQQWRSAATNAEKYELEDRYFKNLKVREIGDTVYIVNLFKINTRSQSYTDTDWDISTYNALRKWRLSVESEGKFRITSATTDNPCDLLVEFQNEGNEYIVSGSGARKSRINPHTNFTYTATASLHFEAAPMRELPFWWSNQLKINAGVLKIEPYVEQVSPETRIIVATFFPDNSAMIGYRGHQCRYADFEWSGVSY